MPDDAEFQCLLCGASVTEEVDNAVDDPDEDTHLPPGWTLVNASRVIANPNYGEENGARELYRQTELASLPPDMPADLRQHVSHRLEALLDLIPRAEPPFTVDTMQAALCPKHGGALQARLQMPDWEE